MNRCLYWVKRIRGLAEVRVHRRMLSDQELQKFMVDQKVTEIYGPYTAAEVPDSFEDCSADKRLK